MIVERIKGFTRVLGAPPGWNPETSGECLGLPIRDEMNGDMPSMVSAWRPTKDELALLNDGAVLNLSVIGGGHPPVSITVAGGKDELTVSEPAVASASGSLDRATQLLADLMDCLEDDGGDPVWVAHVGEKMDRACDAADLFLISKFSPKPQACEEARG